MFSLRHVSDGIHICHDHCIRFGLTLFDAKKTAWNATMIGSASSFYSRDKYSPSYIVRQLFVAIELRLGEENKATVRCEMFSKRLVI